MKYAVTAAVVVSALAIGPSLTALQAQQPASIVLHNGKVVTVDANFSTAQAVAITGQRITAVGTNQEVLALAGPNTQQIDLKGRTVVPGLIDTHLHIYEPGGYGANLTPAQRRQFPIDYRAVKTKEDVLNQIKGWMDKQQFKSGEWVYFGGGGGEEALTTKIKLDDLTRWDLDKVTPNNPIAVSVINDFNGILVNSKAIDLLWDQYGDFIKKYGRYWVDSGGRPDGHLEPPAHRIVLTLLPEMDPEVLAPLQKRRLEELSAMGLTTVSTRMPDKSLEGFKLLQSRGEMTVRIGYGAASFFGKTTDLTRLQQLAKLVGSGTDVLWVTSVSPIAMDGAATRACTDQKRMTDFGVLHKWWPVGQCHTDIEFRGAAEKAAPISGNYYKEWVMASGQYGVRFANTHVAGDRSAKNILNIIEEAQQQYGPASTKSWAFDHCTLFNPADAPQAARLGITFSCAPKYIEDVAPEAAKVYGEKIANTYVVPVKSLLSAGAKVVFETDRGSYTWSDMELLMTRRDESGKVWGPQERLDRVTILKMITAWAADYVLKSDKLGSIEPGKLADLVVLDKDYLTIPEGQISEIQPQLTVFDGKIVYVHSQFAQEYNLRPAGAMISTYKDLTARRGSGGGGSGD